MKTYTKAVSATLAGALAVGMVPAMALADDVALEQLSVESIAAFNGGKVSAVASGGYSEHATAKGVWTVAADGTAKAFAPQTVILTDGTTTVDVSDADDYVVTYYAADSSGKITTTKVSTPSAIGTYYAVIAAGDATAYAGAKLEVKIILTGKALTGSVIGSLDKDGKVTKDDDAKFTYTAEALKVGFELADGTDLVPAEQYTVKYYADTEDASTAAGSTVAPTAVGGYYAILTGVGEYHGSTHKVDLDIEKYTMSDSSNVVIDPVYGATTALPAVPTTVEGSAALASNFKVALTSGAVGVGQFDVTVAAPENDKNVAGSKANAKAIRYGEKAIVKYGTSEIAASKTVDKSEPTSYVDLDAIKAYDKNGKEIDAQYVKISVQDVTDPANPKDVAGDNAALETVINGTAGKYAVTVLVSNTADYSIGGKAVMNVSTVLDTMDGDKNLYFYYDADGNGTAKKPTVVSGSVSMVYDGVDLKTKITHRVLDGASTPKDVTEDTNLKFYNDKGELLTGDIKDAGTYTVKAEYTDYAIDKNTLTVVIKPVEITKIRVQNASTVLKKINGKDALEWQTGDVAQDLTFEYYVDADGDGKEDAGEWMVDEAATAVPASFVITYDGKEVTNFTKKGDYTVSLVAGNSDADKNYKITASDLTVFVESQLVFIDVTEDHWAYQSVVDAYNQGYVTGHSGTKLYGIDENTTRAQLVSMIFKMAGAPTQDPSYYVDGRAAFDTGFEDCLDTAWYSEAVLWAHENGIANGHDGDFRPGDQVTREETVAFLHNYAEVTGQLGKAAAGNELAAYPDGSKVSNWAKGVACWGIANDVWGNGKVLNAKAYITRGEMAAMGVNLQKYNLDQTKVVI